MDFRKYVSGDTAFERTNNRLRVAEGTAATSWRKRRILLKNKDDTLMIMEVDVSTDVKSSQIPAHMFVTDDKYMLASYYSNSGRVLLIFQIFRILE